MESFYAKLIPQILLDKLIILMPFFFYVLLTANNFMSDRGTDANMLVLMQLAVLQEIVWL